MANPPRKILFVCLGNICRSPAAHTAFEAHLAKAGLAGEFTVESCGMGDWHVGELADSRMRETARRHGATITHRARHFRADDLETFDLILAMDEDNKRSLLSFAKKESQRAKIRLLREFDEDADAPLEVPDPYYGGPKEFEEVWTLVDRCTARLLSRLTATP
ncbi:MAG: low molecular weight phosphotyrosine protein phosphatase [Spirochaetes bacterium]|nr:low molecular weight phosphotyrosine protein phosphatase [Spirochaetota bacterium]